MDADDPIEDESEDSIDEEEEDDTAELMAELQRIKAERASDLAKKVFFLMFCNLCNNYSGGYLGNGTKTRRGTHQNGKYFKWKSFVKLCWENSEI